MTALEPRPKHRSLTKTLVGFFGLLILVALSAHAEAPPPESDKKAKRHTLGLFEPGVVEEVFVGGHSDRGTPRLMDVAIGDLNGDGVDDLALGAPGYDPNGQSKAGSVLIVFGRTDLLNDSASRDLSLFEHTDARIDGVESGAQLGTRIAIADVNGDGIGDLIMTAPGGDGAVYVREGEADWPRGALSLNSPEAVDLTIKGDRPGSLLGATLCTGDLNQDQRSDLVFGGLEFNDQGKATSTVLYVLPGRSKWARAEYNSTERLPGAVRLARPLLPGLRAMHTCAMGDLDDDGAGDVVAGMPLDSPGGHGSAGSLSIVLDVLSQTTGNINLGEETPTFGVRVKGWRSGLRLGQALVIADLNGDGRDDLAVGVPGFHRARKEKGKKKSHATPREGAVLLYWGGDIKPNPTQPLRPDFVLPGTPKVPYGQHLNTFDLDGDKRQDLFISSPHADSNEGLQSAGIIDVYLGVEKLLIPEAEGDTDASRQVRHLSGSAAMTRLGFSMASGDLNGDGALDWVIRGASNALGRRAAGSIHVIPDAASRGASSALDEGPVLTLVGPGRGGALLSRVSADHDVDGDGINDPIWVSPEGAGPSGIACIQRSASRRGAEKSASPRTSMLAEGDCDLRLVSPPGSRLSAIDVGDFNGDKVLDIALGFDDHAINGEAVGAIAVVPMPDESVKRIDFGAEVTGQWWWIGGKGSEGLGRDVRFGDINRDGIMDLLVAADRASAEDNPEAGALLVIKGEAERRPGRYRATKNEGILYRFDGDNHSKLGPGSQILDFDGDDKPDLLVMSPHASTPSRPQAGIAYLVYDVARLQRGDHLLADPHVAPLRLVGPSEGSLLEHGAAMLDLDGDGLDDLLLNAPFARQGGITRGSIHVVYGRQARLGAEIDLAIEGGSDLTIAGPRFAGRLSSPAAGDLNGDGLIDLALSAQWAGESEEGAVFINFAKPGKPFKGLIDLDRRTDYDLRIEGQEAHAGLLVPERLPDLNGDGKAELWLISPYADDVVSDQGKVYRISTDALQGRP